MEPRGTWIKKKINKKYKFTSFTAVCIITNTVSVCRSRLIAAGRNLVFYKLYTDRCSIELRRYRNKTTKSFKEPLQRKRPGIKFTKMLLLGKIWH